MEFRGPWHLLATRLLPFFFCPMATLLVAGCWLLAFEACAALHPTPAAQRHHVNPTRQPGLQTLPVNPFPRANSVWLQTNDPVPVAMERLVRYYQAQGYVVDTVDREIFFTVRAHTTLQLPQRPVRLDVRASFGGLAGTVSLQATYEPRLVAKRPTRPRQVRYTTFLAPARRAAFLELQRVSREAFPGALLTYCNEVR